MHTRVLGLDQLPSFQEIAAFLENSIIALGYPDLPDLQFFSEHFSEGKTEDFFREHFREGKTDDFFREIFREKKS